tara:strand:+ start:202 stop:375 length:174 start_codon:yes stop_codon:yes gene_type:complete
MINESITNQLQILIDRGTISKVDLAEEIGISRTTLDVRLKISNWKKSEVTLIKAKFI